MKVGNKVRIMSWNNICKTFEVEERYNDNIQVEVYINTEKYGYDESIKKFCGKLYEISEVLGDGFYKLKGIEDYTFTDEILKFVEEW